MMSSVHGAKHLFSGLAGRAAVGESCEGVTLGGVYTCMIHRRKSFITSRILSRVILGARDCVCVCLVFLLVIVSKSNTE